MKQINLLPPELANQERRQRIIPVLVLVVIAAIGSVLAPWYLFGALNDSLVQSIDAQEKVLGIKANPQEAAKQDAIGKDLAIISNKTLLLNTLAKRETNWSLAFTQLSKLVPKEVTLSGYSMGMSAVDATYRLTGVAPTSLSFGNFIESLKSNTDIKSVTVDGFNLSPTKGDVTFTVVVVIPVGKVQYQPTEVAGGKK